MKIPVSEAPRFVGSCEVFNEIASGGYATVYLGRWLGGSGFGKDERLELEVIETPIPCTN